MKMMIRSFFALSLFFCFTHFSFAEEKSLSTIPSETPSVQATAENSSPAQEITPTTPTNISAPTKTSNDIPTVLAKMPENASESKKEGFTINYNNVSVIEYIRFASKICNVNFLFDEKDLAFNVTVISAEPIDPANVMAMLVQILRIHGLSLLEQDQNLVIHKNENVRQIAKIIPEGEELSSTSPIVTRIFRIRNAKVATVATVLQPMMSKEALLEMLPETRQLIITDVTANIKKIAELIDMLDSPQSPLDIAIYVAKVNQPDYLTGLATQIMTPLLEGSPFLLVPQLSNGSIFIISTPKLIEKALSILANLDTSPIATAPRYFKPENIFLYKAIYRPANDLRDILQNIAKNLQENGLVEAGLVEAIHSVIWIQETNSLLFTGNKESLEKVKEILASIDVTPSAGGAFPGMATFFLYKIQNTPKDHLLDSLNEFAANLKKSKVPETDLIQAIESVQYIKQTNSLFFTGKERALSRLKELLPSFDIEALAIKGAPSTARYFLYKLQHMPGDVIEEDLENFAKNLRGQGPEHSSLLEVIDHIKWIKETNSLLLTGNPNAIEEAKELIVKYDVPRKEQAIHGNFFIYKPKYVSPETIQNQLMDISLNLQKAELADPSLINAIQSQKYVESNNSIIFTGNPESLTKIKDLIQTIDVPSAKETLIKKEGAVSFIVYQIKAAPVQQITSSLQAIANDLKKAGTADKDFLDVLNSMKYQKETNSLLFTGVDSALTKTLALVERFDVPSTVGEAGPSAFFIYKPEHLSGPSLQNILFDFAEHLKLSGLDNPSLFAAINSMKWTENTQSILFTGTPQALEEIKGLLKTFDVPARGEAKEIVGKAEGGAPGEIQPIDDTNFLVYKLQYHKGNEIQIALKQIGKDLVNANAAVKANLLNAINSIQWIEVTNSLLCSGDTETVTRLRELIKSLDIPLKQVFIEMLVIQTSFNNLLDFGLEWGGKFQNSRIKGGFGNFAPAPSGTINPFQASINSLSLTNPLGTDVPLGSGFDLGIIGNVLMHKGKSFLSLGELLKALQTDNETTIVMTPKIITQDNKISKIFIGQNIPYVGSTVSNNFPNNNQMITSNLEYRDVGMDLSLTPVLGNSDIVTLTIQMENTSVITNAAGAAVNVANAGGGITTSKTSMNTTVHIPNKNFLILSGMVLENKQKGKTGIPCLGAIPILGAAFSETTHTESKDNIVIFIRPHVINSFQDMVHLTETQEDYFRDNAGTPLLERIFDESTELIKPIEKESPTP